MIPPDIFGEYTWLDVQNRIHQRIRRRWGGMSEADREDAVAAAMVDLVDWWTTRPKSLEGSADRRFNFAVWHGTNRANQFLAQEASYSSRLTPLDGDDAYFSVEPPADRDLLEEEERQRIERTLRLVPKEEWDSWLSDYLAGMPTVAAAAKHGVAQPTISKRRMVGMQRLRERFRKTS